LAKARDYAIMRISTGFSSTGFGSTGFQPVWRACHQGVAPFRRRVKKWERIV